MTLASTPPCRPLWQRLFFAIPVIGWVAHDLLFRDADNIWYALVAFVSLWMCAVLTFGLPGLYLPALALVPVILATLILITWG
jgi:hypothetical protein